MLVDYLMFNSILKGSRLWCLWSKLEEPLLRPFALEPLFLWLSTKPWVWSARPLVPFVLTLLRTLNTCTGIVRSLTRKGSTGRWPWKMARLAGNKQHVPIGAPGWGQGTNAKVVGGPLWGLSLAVWPGGCCSCWWSHCASTSLRTRRFSEPSFPPSGATNHWKKHSVSRLSYLFGHLDLLSSETFSSLIFSLLLFSSLFFCSTSAFHLSISSEVWLLNFLRSCIRGSQTIPGSKIS